MCAETLHTNIHELKALINFLVQYPYNFIATHKHFFTSHVGGMGKERRRGVKMYICVYVCVCRYIYKCMYVTLYMQ